MMATTKTESGPIHASLNHLANIPLWKQEKPFELWTEAIPHGLNRRTNVQFESIGGVLIKDVRDLPEHAKPKLDREGFEYLHHPFPVLKLRDVENINEDENKRAAMTEYISAMATLLRDHFKGRKAICYDWRVRWKLILMKIS